MRKTLIFLAAALILSACASGPRFMPALDVPSDCGLVYFYRPDALIASGTSYSIKWMENPLGKLKNNSYFSYSFRPGTYTFYYEGHYGFAKVTVEIAAGETYYICGRPSRGLGTKFKMEQVHPAIGQAEIKDCRLSL